MSQYKALYKVATETTEVTAEISGKLRHSSNQASDYPAVGDFVMVDREDGLHGNALIHHVLTRKSAFLRRAAGTAREAQVVAANIDTVFICMSLNSDFNLRRLERYLSITFESGATPVVLLTKSDLCKDLPTRLSEIGRIAVGVDVLVTSSISEGGYKATLKYISSGQTVAFMGSSGVGKSTLINRLLGADRIKTRETGKDDKGRHATTRRELHVIPSGGAVIDTPGMRELGVESVTTADTFMEIEERAAQCRFRDCRHEHEPGCAVRVGIDAGEIADERLQSYMKLKKEAKYDEISSRQIEEAKTNKMVSGFGGMKNAREYIRSKEKLR